MSIKVLIADDHALIREGIRKILSLEKDITVVDEAADGHQALALALAGEIDIVLLDINMPGLSGIEVCRRLKAARPEIGIIALTIHEQEEYLLEMIAAGASAYLLKDVQPDQLVRVIRGVAAGESYIPPQMMRRVLNEFSRLEHKAKGEDNNLTARELEILQLVAQGATNKEIAARLFISEKTVKNHLYRIFQKLGVEDRTQAVTLAIKNRLLKL